MLTPWPAWPTTGAAPKAVPPRSFSKTRSMVRPKDETFAIAKEPAAPLLAASTASSSRASSPSTVLISAVPPSMATTMWRGDCRRRGAFAAEPADQDLEPRRCAKLRQNDACAAASCPSRTSPTTRLPRPAEAPNPTASTAAASRAVEPAQDAMKISRCARRCGRCSARLSQEAGHTFAGAISRSHRSQDATCTRRMRFGKAE
mmetsp:Transcript_99016/g.284603  ORF Transcript_99016/g.284603 Transcript_99016/m.284603 type:complete len:203 (-) Transcript_99016:9-617(-)